MWETHSACNGGFRDRKQGPILAFVTTTKGDNCMMRSKIVRFGTAGLFLAAPFALVVGLSGPASATQPAVTLKIKCTSLSGNVNTTVTLSGCNGNSGGGSTPIMSSALQSGGTITWLNGKTTTIAAPALTPGTNCPAGDTDLVAKAMVTADTTGSVTVGSKTKVEVCYNSSGTASLPPGKKAKI